MSTEGSSSGTQQQARRMWAATNQLAADHHRRPSAPGAAARIAGALASGEREQREVAHEELRALVAAGAADEAAVQAAAACIAPLIRSVLSAEASKVEGAEAGEASLLLGRLMLLDPVVVGREWLQEAQGLTTWITQSTALAAVYSKEAGAITRDDALLVARDRVPSWIFWSRGPTHMLAAAGLEELPFVSAFITTDPLYPARTPTEAVNERLMTLALQFIREDLESPPSSGLCDLEVAGMWWLVSQSMAHRPALGVAAISAGMFDLGMAAMRKSSPSSWIGCRTPRELKAAGPIGAMWQPLVAVPPGLDHAQLCIDSGFAEALVSCCQAYELSGASNAGSANKFNICICLQVLVHSLDLTAPASAPIMKLLRGIPTALRFIVDHPLEMMPSVGQETRSLIGMLCAIVFGKNEEEVQGGDEFQFSQDIIEVIPNHLRQIASGPTAAYYTILPAHYLQPLVQLCISDKNKSMLVSAKDLVPLLQEMLFLDMRKDISDESDGLKADKKAIQADAAECILQLAVFEPAGRELLEQHPSVMDALCALASGGKALTEEARVSAVGALMAIENTSLSREPEPEGATKDESEGHVMLSCE
jgi:hypothetical protein